MGRKTVITREMILQAAYELLEESGIGAVAIKSIASKLDCSTQPISWQFGSMTKLKKELYFYAGEKLYGPMAEEMKGKSAVDAFFASGVMYITIACEHPNVFRFINLDDPTESIGESITGDTSIFSTQFDEEAVKLLAKEYDVPKKVIGETVRDIVIYTHGLAAMMIFDNFKLSKAKACRMVYDVGVKMLKTIGIDEPVT